MTNKHNKHRKTKAPRAETLTPQQRAEIMRRRKELLSDALRAKWQVQNEDILEQIGCNKPYASKEEEEADKREIDEFMREFEEEVRRKHAKRKADDDVPTPSEREALLKSRGIKIDPTTGLSDRFTDIWNDESTFTPIDDGEPEMTDDELEEYLRNIPNKKQKG